MPSDLSKRLRFFAQAFSLVCLLGILGCGDIGVQSPNTTPGEENSTNGTALLALTQGATLSFGVTQIGVPAQQTLTLQNNGTGTASQISVGSLPAPFSLQTNNCTGNVSAGSSCQFVFGYNPSSNSDSMSTSATLSYFDGVQTKKTAVTLQGKASAFLNLAVTNNGNFGALRVGEPTVLNANTNVTLTCTLTNVGQSPASAIAPSIMGAGSPVSVVIPTGGNSCGASLMPLQSCTFQLSINVSNIFAGPSAGSLQVAFNDGSPFPSQVLTQSLLASVQNGANLIVPTLTSVTPSIYVGGSTKFSIAVQNQGVVPATKAALNLRGNSSYSLDSTAIGGAFCAQTSATLSSFTVAAGSSCNIGVIFSPQSGTTIAVPAQINFSDAVGSATVNTPISGVGLSPILVTVQSGSLPNNTFDFASQIPNTPSSALLVVRNFGPIMAILNGGSVAFKQSFAFNGGTYPGTRGNCGANLQSAGAANNADRCLIDVAFTPGSAGNSTSGEIDFNYSVSNSPLNIGPLVSTALLTGKAIDCTNVTSFGSSGQVTWDPTKYLGAPASTTLPTRIAGFVNPRGALVQSSGKTVVGDYLPLYPNQFGLIRFNCDGTQDPTFGMEGAATVTVGSGALVHDIALQGSNIIAVGETTDATSAIKMAIARFDANGNLDTSFGTSGITTSNFGFGGAVGNAVVIGSDRTIYVGGTSDPASFSDGASPEASALIAHFDAQGNNPTFQRFSYTSSGSPVPSRITSLALGPSNLIAGGDENSHMLYLVFNPANITGSPLTSLTYSASNLTIFDLVAPSTGDVFFAGTQAESGGNAPVAGHVLSNMTLDTGWNGMGVATQGIEPAMGYALAESNGKLVLGGEEAGSDNDSLIIQLVPSTGIADTTFNKLGNLLAPFSTSVSYAKRVLVPLTPNFTLLTGTAGAYPFIMRVSTAGTLN